MYVTNETLNGLGQTGLIEAGAGAGVNYIKNRIIPKLLGKKKKKKKKKTTVAKVVSKPTNWLLIGGLAVGAVVLFTLLRPRSS